MTAAQVAEKVGTYTRPDNEKAKAFAAAVGANLGTSAGTSTFANSVHTISGLSAGYYLVKDSTDVSGEDASTRFILELVDDVKVLPKSSVPSVVKKVQEDDYANQGWNTDNDYGDGYNDVADWNIGDNVPFKLIGTLPSTLADYDTYTYIFHDKMTIGLTAPTSVTVTIGGTTVPPTTTVNGASHTNYTYTHGEVGNVDETDTYYGGDTMTIAFQDVLDLYDADGNKINVTSDNEIIVTYNAVLNSDAKTGQVGNENEVYLEFSNDPNADGIGETGTTEIDQVIVFTYELDVTKIDGAGVDEDTGTVLPNVTKLADAEFVLLNSDGTQVAKIDNGKFDGWVDVSDVSNNEKPSYDEWTTHNEMINVILESNSEGLFSITGLDDGIYLLREIKAPDNYNLPETDFTVVIDATTSNGQKWNGSEAALTDLDVTVDGKNGTPDVGDGTANITIANNKGATLPSTGGMGTTVFYTVGAILMIGAGVTFIARKRTDKEISK